MNESVQPPEMTTVYRVRKSTRGHRTSAYTSSREIAEDWIAQRKASDEDLRQASAQIEAMLEKYPLSRFFGSADSMIQSHKHAGLWMGSYDLHSPLDRDSNYLRIITEKAAFEKEFLALGLSVERIAAIQNFTGVETFSIEEIQVEHFTEGEKVFIILAHTDTGVLDHRFIGDSDIAHKTLHRLEDEKAKLGKAGKAFQRATKHITNQLSELAETLGATVSSVELELAVDKAYAFLPTLYAKMPSDAQAIAVTEYRIDEIRPLNPADLTTNNW